MEYSFIIRRAVEDDAPAVYNILQTAFSEYARAAGLEIVDALKETIDDIKNEIKSKMVYIAVIDNVIVGTVRVDLKYEDASAYISRFAVGSETRNIGIGKSLMNLVDKYLISEGIKMVYLHTASQYNLLVRFYYGRGFYVDSVNTDRGYIRIRMAKALSN